MTLSNLWDRPFAGVGVSLRHDAELAADVLKQLLYDGVTDGVLAASALPKLIVQTALRWIRGRSLVQYWKDESIRQEVTFAIPESKIH